MTTQIHGHEVIEMMTTSNEDYTKESLTAAMDAGALIEFLTERGKFQPGGEGFRFNPAKACGH